MKPFAAIIAISLLASADAKAADRVWRATGESAGPELVALDDTMRAFMVKRKISAGALAVTYQGRLMLAKGYGWAGKEEPLVGPESLFRIASLSKPITAVAVLHLVEAGKLRLDEKVVEVLDLAPVKGKTMDQRLPKVTILHLLQHLGGWDRAKSYDPMFRDRRFAAALRVPLPIGTADIIACMNGEPLQSEPGTTYAYSNYGYCLLGRVIEKRSGMTYEEYVRQEILAPLAIRNMRIGKSRLAERFPGEVQYEGERPYGGFRVENLDAHGGWLASAVDLARFVAALDDPNHHPALSAASIERMFALPENLAGKDYQLGDSYYACGWQVRDYGNGQRNTWHTGSLPGTYTFLARWRSGIGCVVLFNQRGKDFAAIDSVMGQATHRIQQWPAGDLFR
ncbi:MAG: beta-lactamase family protein [Verrucomicrobia bacterium]|nr:beta-lactamase family protein [Verrucomicrobiota bacterium]